MSETTVVKKSSFFGGLFRKKSSAVAAKETAEQKIQRERLEKEAEGNRRFWIQALENPPQDFLAQYLKSAGLPEDVTQVLGHTCIFWLKDDRMVYGLAYAARIEAVHSFGPSLWVQLSSRSLKGETVSLIHNNGWRISGSFLPGLRSILQFKLL